MIRTDPPAPVMQRTPALAVVLRRALELAERPNSLRRDADLVQLIEVDPHLRGALLRIVRCPLYAIAGLDLPLSAALERLGTETVADAFRALWSADAAPTSVDAETACRRWLHGIAVAAAARWISNQGDHDAPDEAYLTGLVHGLCHPTEDPRSLERAAEFRFGRRIETVARLGPLYGRTSSESSLLVAGEPLDPGTRRLFQVVSRGDVLANALGFGAEPCPATLSPDEGEAAAVAEAVALELAHAAGLVGLSPQPFESLVRELAAREAEARAQWIVSARDAAPPDVRRLAESQQETLGLRSSGSIPEILERGLAALHRGLGFDRVVVLEREHGNPSAARVRALVCRTRLAGPGPRSLVEVALPQGGALVRALEEDCATRSGPGDGETLLFLGSTSFAAAPLRAGSGSVGLVVADRPVSRGEVTEADAAALALAAGTLGLVLETAALQAEGKTLRALAEKDALTGINNRRNVLEILRREIDRARRYGKPLSVALIDVDHFKSWNDLHGHQVGDMVLQTVAQLISSCSREIDACGRYGGEEFLVVLPETTVEHAVLYGERLRQTIESHAADLTELYGPAGLTVSIGMTQLLPRGDDADQMIQRADRALYAAKSHGRNRVCVEAGSGAAKPSALPVARSVLEEI
jgi:diguanylate cyclase (GGDEF)-like protein